MATFSLGYGGENALGGANLNDWLSASLELQTKHFSGIQIGENQLFFEPWGKATYFFAGLDIGADEFVNEVSEQYELGVALTVEPILRIWKIRLPLRVRISYGWGDGLEGILIRFS